jgi:xylulokinase
MTCFIGLDIGTTNSKGLLLDTVTRRLVFASQQTQVNLPGPAGWAEFNPDQIFEGVIRLIKEILQQVENPNEIRALAISSMGETGVPVGPDGSWIYPAISWYDLRTVTQSEWIADHVGASMVYKTTGLPISTSYGLLKLMWLKENQPAIFQMCKGWLPIGDYIAYKLCGVQATDRTQAWRTMACDINQLSWSDELLDKTGIPASTMVEIVPSGTSLGQIKREIAALTGLAPDCLVVSGGMDAVCGMVAVGATVPGVILDIIGTSEIVISTLDKLSISEAAREASLDVGPHAVDGRYLAFGSMTAAGSVVEWFARLFDTQDSGKNLDDLLSILTHEAEKSSISQIPAIQVLPHFRGSRTPHSDVLSRGLFLGLDLGSTRGQLFRALLEGLSFESRLVFETLNGLTKWPPKEIWVAGGVTNNPLWMSIKASVLGHNIWIPMSPSISAYGAALLAACGACEFRSIEDAANQMAIQHRCAALNSELMGKYNQQYYTQYLKLYSLIKEGLA